MNARRRQEPVNNGQSRMQKGWVVAMTAVVDNVMICDSYFYLNLARQMINNRCELCCQQLLFFNQQNIIILSCLTLFRKNV